MDKDFTNCNGLIEREKAELVFVGIKGLHLGLVEWIINNKM